MPIVLMVGVLCAVALLLGFGGGVVWMGWRLAKESHELEAKKSSKDEDEFDPRKIRELEKELGMLPSYPSLEPLKPRELPKLDGTSPHACALPKIESEYTFHVQYGDPDEFGVDKANKAQLDQTLAQIRQIVDDYAALGPSASMQELLDRGQVALRRIGRLERSLEPLFAGLTYSTHGRARQACIAARADIANVLEEAAVEGRL